MRDSQDSSLVQVLRILAPVPCTSRSTLKRLNREADSPCFVACEPLCLRSKGPSSSDPEDVVLWDDSTWPSPTEKKQIAEIRTREPFLRADIFLCSSTLSLKHPWEPGGIGVVPTNESCTLQHQLCAANHVICGQARSPWKQSLARLLCCSPGVQRGPSGELSLMTARVLQRLLVSHNSQHADGATVKRPLLWRAVLATLFSHALAWVATSMLPESSEVLGSHAVEEFFGGARAGLDWLCQQPGGFKVHVEWAQTLAILGHAAIGASQQLALLAVSVAPYVRMLLVCSARVAGMHVALSMAADLLLMLSLPTILLHKVTWAVQAVQLATVKAMWDLVRGRRDARRELRLTFHTVTSQLRHLLGKGAAPTEEREYKSSAPATTDVLIEQLLVGMLFLAPLIATLPTTWLLHAVATMLHLVVLLSRCIIHSTVAVLEMGSVCEFLLWVGQPWWGSARLGGHPDIRFIGSSTASVVVHGSGVPSRSCEVAYFHVCTAYIPLSSALTPLVEHVAREMRLMKQLLA